MSENPGTFEAALLSNALDECQSLEDIDDEVLVMACQAGDLSAFDALVTRHEKVLFNLAYRMTGSVEDAKDVVQESFLAAYKALSAFRRESRFRTWMTSITLNQARNRLNRLSSKRRREAYSLDGPARGEEDGARAGEPEALQVSALDLLEKEALKKQLERCLQALEPEFREAILLRDYFDRSYEEISAALKIREGTVKSRLFRARDSIRACLKRALGGL